MFINKLENKNYNKWHNKFTFFKCNQHVGISSHISFRVLIDKIASVYSILKIYFLF